MFGGNPTRADPNQAEGSGFVIAGNDHTFVNNTVVRTFTGSSISGTNHTITDSYLPTGLSGDLRSSRITDSVIGQGLNPDGYGHRLSASGSNNTLRNITSNWVSLGGTNSSITNSQLSSLDLRSNASAVNNTITSGVRYEGSSAVSVRLRGTNITLAESRVHQLTAGAANSTLRDVTVSSDSRSGSVWFRGSGNTVENVTAGSITLVSSPNNTIRNSTAESIKLNWVVGEEIFPDNNTLVGNTADEIVLSNNARNNTIRGNDATVRVAGTETFDNRIVGNDASGSTVGIEIDRASRTTVRNNTVTGNDRGIVLVGATDNRLANNTAVGNAEWDYYSASASTNNTVTNLTVGPTLSFDSRDVAIREAADPPRLPAGIAGVGAYVVVNGTSVDSWADLTVQYADSDTVGVDEESLRLWRYADGSWEPVGEEDRLDVALNRVGANVSGSDFGVVAPLGNATDDQQPYDGTAPALPGEIDASHFDTGGEGVAYHDDEPARRDDSGFRPEVGVDIESPSLGGTGDGSIGYVEPGEWVEYTVDAEPGTYRLALAVASKRDGKLTVSVDGREIGAVTKNTGGWYNFAEVDVGEFTIEEGGKHTIRIESTEGPINYDSLVVEEADSTPTQQAYGGTAPALPGEIDASHFDTGGEGVAYHDDEPERRDDSGFRSDVGVDIESPSLGGTGDGSIGYVEPGEWVEYTVDAEPGTYRLSLAVASKRDGKLTVSVDGREIGAVTKNTGGWYNFAEVEAGEFTIEEGGEHVIRIESTEGPINYDSLVVEEADSTPTQQAYGGTAPTLPGEIDASHFDTGGEGVAYHDDEAARRDDSGFRPEVGVDIESPSLGGTGDGSIGYAEESEWVEYTVDAEPGTYRLALAVASKRDGELTASIDGREIGAVTKNTGGWYNFAEVEAGEFTIEEGGEYTIRIESTGPFLNLDSLVVEEADSTSTQQPYDGTAPALPGEIDASHFDTGGEGVAYHDDEPERRDDSGFRPEVGVDIESPSLGGTGDGSIGYAEEGEWVEYTVDAEPGTYRLSLAVASERNGELTASIDGREIGSVAKNTGGWYNFAEVETGEFTIEEGGEHVIRIESTGPFLNLDSLVVEEADSTPTQQAYGGTAPALPGEIDASHFDTGGEGVAYHDDEAARRDDSGFRPEVGVDIESPSLGGTGDGSIGYAEEGEWVEYTVDAEPGTYRLALAVASERDGELTASIDGREIGAVTKNTGGWYNFAEVEAGEFTIEEGGEHVIRIESTGPFLNLDSLVVEESGTDPAQQPYDGTAPTLPGEIDASHFDTGGEDVAYHDDEAARRDDSGFRPEVGVDIESPSLGGTGDGSIGYVEPGEWVEYTVDAEPGTYRLSLTVASERNGELTASVDGREIGSVAKNTGGWYNFAEVEVGEFTIEEGGEHTIRIEWIGPPINVDRLVVEGAEGTSAVRSSIEPDTRIDAPDAFGTATLAPTVTTDVGPLTPGAASDSRGTSAPTGATLAARTSRSSVSVP
ncbi:carbohydrate-binding domain-containing protein [Salinigranum salinum]|uniref:carbohydrate-binding domain-containing protein n=1 Tax=Salinigranum salinum TaxID=1364937 RepID=UPI002AA2B355